jgi:hypothetical protein
MRIQRTFRRRKKRAQLKLIFYSIKRLQTLFRVRFEHKKFRKKQFSLRKIQHWFRHILFKRGLSKFFKLLARKRYCVTKIASFFRRNKAIMEYMMLKDKIYKLQRSVLLFLGRKKRKLFRFCKKTTEDVVEKAWKIIRKSFEKFAAIYVQKFWRGLMCRKKFRKECEILKELR